MKTLEGKKRDSNASLEAMRQEGYVPAIVYGKGMDTLMLTVFGNDVRSLWREVGDHGTFSLDIEGTTYPVIMKDIQTHVVTGDILHIDFVVSEA